MDNTLVRNSKMRALWIGSVACLAVGFSAACGAHIDADEDGSASETRTTEKAVHLDGIVGAGSGCRNELVSCDPPVFVNGREIKCMKEVCDSAELDDSAETFDELDPSILDAADLLRDLSPLSR